MGGAGGHFSEACEALLADALLLHGAQVAVGSRQGLGEDHLLLAPVGGAKGHAPALGDEDHVGDAGESIGSRIFGDPHDAADRLVAAQQRHEPALGEGKRLLAAVNGAVGQEGTDAFEEPPELGVGGAHEVLVGPSDALVAPIGRHVHEETVVGGLGGVEEEDFAHAAGGGLRVGFGFLGGVAGVAGGVALFGILGKQHEASAGIGIKKRMGDGADFGEQLGGTGGGYDPLIKTGEHFKAVGTCGELAILHGELLVDAAELGVGVGDAGQIELARLDIVQADGAGADLERFGEVGCDIFDVLGGEAQEACVLFDVVGEQVIAGEADVLAAHEHVGQAHEQDHAEVDDASAHAVQGVTGQCGGGFRGVTADAGNGGQGRRGRPVEPDGLGDELWEVPGFGEAFAGEGMIEADDAAFEIGDVAAGESGHFDGAGEALGHDGVESDFADVMEEAADEGIGGLNASAGTGGAHLGGEHFGGGGDGQGVFPEFLAAECGFSGGSGSAGVVVGGGRGSLLENFEDLD